MDFTINLPSNSLPPAVPWLLLIWGVVFLFTLGRALARPDLAPVTRLTWVVVLIFVPFFGVVLYAFIAPPLFQPKTDPANQLAGTPWENDPGHRRSSHPAS